MSQSVELGGPYSQPEEQEQHEMALEKGESRSLTGGEIAMGKQVYPYLDYSKPRIFRKSAYLFQPNDRAMSPDGNIYFHPEDQGYYDDFSNAPVRAKHTFVHELGHVSQTQGGENVRAAVFDRNYDYWPLQTGKRFFTYGLEQRAEMIADYFILKNYQMMRPSLLNSTPRPIVNDYEMIIPFVYPSGSQE
jgi:hypothetical protein